MSSLLRRLARIGFRKGIGGGHRAWLALGLVTWVAARSREKAGQAPVLHREVLAPGESMTVRVLKPLE